MLNPDEQNIIGLVKQYMYEQENPHHNMKKLYEDKANYIENSISSRERRPSTSLSPIKQTQGEFQSEEDSTSMIEKVNSINAFAARGLSVFDSEVHYEVLDLPVIIIEQYIDTDPLRETAVTLIRQEVSGASRKDNNSEGHVSLNLKKVDVSHVELYGTFHLARMGNLILSKKHPPLDLFDDVHAEITSDSWWSPMTLNNKQMKISVELSASATKSLREVLLTQWRDSFREKNKDTVATIESSTDPDLKKLIPLESSNES